MSITASEAALLGLLSEGEKHPYQIEKDVQFRDMRYWTDLSMSAIYKSLTKLEFMNYVESTNQVTEENRVRKVYQLTPEGMDAFKEKLAEMLAEPEHLRWQADISFYNFGVLPIEQQRELLLGYKKGLEAHLIECKALEDYLVESGCTIYHQSLARRWYYMTQGEISWIDSFLEEIRS